MQLTPAQLAAANDHYEDTLNQVKEFCTANDLPALYEAIAPATAADTQTLGDLFAKHDAFVADRPYLTD